MSLGAGIFDFMAGSLSVGVRVYPLTLPQGVELPAVTYQRISDEPTIAHSTMQDNVAWTGVRHVRTRVQFSCYGQTYDDAEALADELLELAEGYSGQWDEVEVQAIVPADGSRIDDRDEAPDIWRVIQDLLITHRTSPSS